MRLFRLSVIFLLLLALTLSTSCEKEESITSTKASKTNKISKPEVKVTSHYANGTYDGWYVIGTVTTGGDDPSNITCTLEWSKFAKKQSGSVKLSNSSKMKAVNTSEKRVQFKKEHAGVNKGNYIYYRLVGNNSKYSSSTTTTYMVVQ